MTRMSQASSSSKTWLLPILTLTYSYAITKHQTWIAVVGALAVLIFGLLDANYLKQERAFRKLYDKVASGGDIPAFSTKSRSRWTRRDQGQLLARLGRHSFLGRGPNLWTPSSRGDRGSFLGPLHLITTRSCVPSSLALSRPAWARLDHGRWYARISGSSVFKIAGTRLVPTSVATPRPGSESAEGWPLAARCSGSPRRRRDRAARLEFPRGRAR